MRSLYVMSKAHANQPRLKGILSELIEGKNGKEGEYRFEYKLGGRLPEWYLMIDEFPDLTKVYTGQEVAPFIRRIVPPRDNKYIKELLESANLTEYNEWEMLKVFGMRNMKQDAYLYETLPEGAIIYENLDTA